MAFLAGEIKSQVCLRMVSFEAFLIVFFLALQGSTEVLADKNVTSPTVTSPPSASSLPAVSGANVNVVNITIYDKHSGWLDMSTDVYFKCRGEINHFLSEVKNVKEPYVYNGTEKFQPVTWLEALMCKRCGLYEADTWSSDDIFSEFDLCVDNFTSRTGLHHISVDGQFDMTLDCPKCRAKFFGSSDMGDESGSSFSIIFWILISFGVLVVLLGLSLFGFLVRKKLIEKSKKDETMKFMQLFDDDDELEAGLEDHRL